MKVRLYAAPEEFLEENAAFLREHEAACQLNLGNAQNNRDECCRPDLLFGRCEEEGRGVLLFGNTLPWNLCLNAVPGDPAALTAAAFLAEYLREKGIAICGVTADTALCKAFFSAFQKPYTVSTSMGLMVLKKLTEPPALPGKVRKAALSELDTATGWARAFTREALREESDETEVREKFRGFIESGKLYLMTAPQGQPVSMAVSNRDLAHGAGISWVYTPPEFRGKGYCQTTVAAVCREKLRSGKDYCTLFVDMKNPISNRVYSKIGFQIIENVDDCRLETPEG